MNCRRIILLALGLGLMVANYGWSYQERLILSVESGLCSLRIEADDQSHALRLRVSPEGITCPIERESMLSALKAASSKTDEPRLGSVYSSLYIGRLVDYPWLSQYLARTALNDPAWSRRRGKPVKLDTNKYVAAVLFGNETSHEIGEALGSTYRVKAVSVEKVLVRELRHVPGYQGKLVRGKVPFDAQVWFRLEREANIP